MNISHGPGFLKEMDDIDRKLLVLIEVNPRIHFRELAMQLGISKQAVHHRMQALTKLGVIRGWTASISVSYADAIPVAVFGRSETASVEKTLSKLGESEHSHRVVVAGGNFLYVIGMLRNVSELEGFAQFVSRTAEMPAPAVGIYCRDEELMPYYPVDGGGKRKQSNKELAPIDLKIISSLKDDARRSIADIADMVGVSAKTVRRHLEDMISEGSVDLSVPSDLQSGGDMFLIMHVNIRAGADKVEVGKRLLSESPFHDQYIRTFSNLPGLLVWVFWSGNIAEIRKVLGDLGKDEDVVAVMLNFAYSERIYPTWLDKLSEALTSSSRKARTRSLPSRLRRQGSPSKR